MITSFYPRFLHKYNTVTTFDEILITYSAYSTCIKYNTREKCVFWKCSFYPLIIKQILIWNISIFLFFVSKTEQLSSKSDFYNSNWIHERSSKESTHKFSILYFWPNLYSSHHNATTFQRLSWWFLAELYCAMICYASMLSDQQMVKKCYKCFIIPLLCHIIASRITC